MANPRKKLDKCQLCGEREKDHHDFVPIEVPHTCKCKPEDWVQVVNIPDVCGKFVENLDGHGLCDTCDHLKECHG